MCACNPSLPPFFVNLIIREKAWGRSRIYISTPLFYVHHLILIGTALAFANEILTNTLLNGKYACPNQEIMFNCTVYNGSIVSVVTGLGETIQFSHGSSPGKKITSSANNNTIVTLLVNNNSSGELTSQLRILPSSDSPTSTVTCANVDEGTSVSVNFTVLGKTTYDNNIEM